MNSNNRVDKVTACLLQLSVVAFRLLVARASPNVSLATTARPSLFSIYEETKCTKGRKLLRSPLIQCWMLDAQVARPSPRPCL